MVRTSCAWPGCDITAEGCEGHHVDYTRPEDVVSLCLKHHKEAHKAYLKDPGPWDSRSWKLHEDKLEALARHRDLKVPD